MPARGPNEAFTFRALRSCVQETLKIMKLPFLCALAVAPVRGELWEMSSLFDVSVQVVDRSGE